MEEEITGQPDGLEENAYDGKAKSSKPWLTMIKDAEKVFRPYQDKCDNIDKQYADLDRLASLGRDRQFQIFWANLQVLGPSIYSRPPVPVVVPRFKDRKPVPRLASEMLERSTVVSFEQEDVDQIMRNVRDDLNRLSRGTAWLRYEAARKGEYLSERNCYDTVHRKDFLHDPARTWREVDWVAKRSFLTKQKLKKRFAKTSGGAYKDAAFEKRKDEEDADDGKLKAAVWELWCKSQNKVVWVTEGVDVCLDEGEPHLQLEGFFPCPRPAYGTLQPGSLIPVPDMLFYKDQLEEINEITARLAALTDAVKVRGFYPAGAGEIGDAIEAAVKATSNNQLLVPISNWSLVGNGGVKDMIVWLPLDMIVATIKELVAQRKQLIDDVYQITGLSDIMRGTTDAEETLGAQELKSQYGSTRIRDKQAELVRFARDLTRIDAEIMAENFQPKTLLAMSQMEIPTKADIAGQIAPLVKQAQQIQAQVDAVKVDPELQQLAAQNPERAQQIAQQAQQQLTSLQGQVQKLQSQVTIEQVMGLLRDQRLRPFVLDIETDSTIAPDENATKQRATEFLTALGGYLNQVVPMLQAMPKAAPFVAEGLKFVAGQYRAGRELEGKIQEFADGMVEQANNPQPTPEQQAAEADQKMKQMEIQQRQQEAQQKAQTEQQKAQADIQAKQQENEAKMAQIQAEMERDREKHAMEMEMMQAELGMKREELQFKRENAQIDQAAKAQQAQIQTESAQQQADISAQSAQQDASIKAEHAEQQADHSERQFQQKSALANQAAAHKQQAARPGA